MCQILMTQEAIFTNKGSFKKVTNMVSKSYKKKNEKELNNKKLNFKNVLPIMHNAERKTWLVASSLMHKDHHQIRHL